MSKDTRIFSHMPALYITKDQVYHRFSPRSSPAVSDAASDQSSRSSNRSQSSDSKPSKLWRNTIAIVMIPFVLTGAPVLSILFTDKSVEQKRFTMIKWLNVTFSDNFALLNIISMIGTLALNGWFLYLVIDILVRLLLWGQISIGFIHKILEIFETIPVVLFVNFFWMKGFRLRQLIDIVNTTSWHCHQITTTSSTIKLVFVLLVAVLLHVIDCLTFRWKFEAKLTTETVNDFYGHLPHRIFVTFLFPLYITIFGAVHARNRRMNDYIRSLVDSQHMPDLIHLRDIKNQFRTNGQLIRHINSLFNILMSVAIVVLVMIIIREALYSSYNLVGAILAYGLEIDFFEARVPHFTTGMVRCMSADIVVVLMKLALIGLTIHQMLGLNHESRSAFVMLNDLVSQLDHIMHRDLYQSYRLLRFYVKSRLDNTDRPNLVYISIFSYVPSLKSVLLIRID